MVSRKGENRVVAVGKTTRGRYLFLACTIRQGTIRPITAYTLPSEKRKKSSPTVDVPDFKNPQQEAEWFDANRTQQLTLRVAVADLERAPAIAKEKGIGYKTVLKQAIREEARQARQARPFI